SNQRRYVHDSNSRRQRPTLFVSKIGSSSGRQGIRQECDAGVQRSLVRWGRDRPRCISFESRRCEMKAAAVAALVVALSSTAFSQVPFRRIASSDTDPSSWLTYSGNYQAQRFSALTQIGRQNVTQLKPAWVYQM